MEECGGLSPETSHPSSLPPSGSVLGVLGPLGDTRKTARPPKGLARPHLN